MSGRTLKLLLFLATSLLLAAVMLAYIGFEGFVSVIVGLSPPLVLASLGLTILLFIIRGVRWKILLSEVGGTDLATAVAATGLGYVVNALIPIRVGEVARALAVSQRRKMTFASAFTTVVVERIFDLVYLVGALSAALLIAPISFSLPELVTYSSWLGAAIGAAGVAFVLLAAKSTKTALSFAGRVIDVIPLPKRWREKAKAFVTSVVEAAASGKRFLIDPSVNALSLSLVIGQALIFALLLEAGGFSLPLGLSIAGGLMVTLSHILPAPPGYLGSFEAVWTATFMGFGMSFTDAATSGLTVHLVSLGFVLVIGVLFSSMLGLRVTDYLFSTREQ